jgi:nucleoredoxin
MSNCSIKNWSLALLSACIGLLSESTQANPQNEVLAAHARDLVSLQGEKLAHFDPTQFLLARYTVLYFGAGWCPDCRRFSPKLVEAYNRQTVGAKTFEVLLVSQDNTAPEMLKFMKTERMAWPALSFEKISAAKDISRYFPGHGIPCLTVIDSKGNILLQSKSDQDAGDILQDLLKLPGVTQKQ